ncbi:UDP-glucose:glycoprotein glucosyltransferase [Eumeta japonica]|uniref:UDP-glucose:glycoprotein glucosyltransferase n=1 Tax=Eumeta variegata TaxID=151549 RepID=A0A4C1X9D5_EUMVA|nr:UDP-glucose:glycoprotein glucosyltransferase [Eumeta japonica]
MNNTGFLKTAFIFSTFLISLVTAEPDTLKKSKSVTTFVNAKWESTSLVLELAEYLALESVDLFWAYVDDVNSLKTSLELLKTDKEKYDSCIGVASGLLAPAQLRIAKLALSMHITSPSVQMFMEIANNNGARDVQCDTFVAIASRLICDNDVLRDVLKSSTYYDPEEHKLETYRLDHYYPSSNNKSLTAILYGELGTTDFSTKHKILADYADRGIINYIVRWNVKPQGKPKLRLSGYGVELQLKSTEYKSQDDSTPKDSEGNETFTTSEEEDENDPQNQIDGFNFGRLKNLFPALRTPLERFRRHLSEASEELAPLKVWQMQALSMQAAAAVLDAHDAGGDEALKVLTSIAQNFPMQTKSLIHVNVPRAFREEVLYNQDIWASSLGLRPAEPLLLVSGAQYDAEEVDILALLAALREDIGPMNTLHALGISKKLINTLMSLELGESYTWEEYGLDIRDTAITWLNDLETDDRYRRWPSSYMEMLRPTYPGMLRNLRRNIYNYVIVIDPISKLSIAPLKLGDTLLKHATPVRVGLVLAPIPDRSHDDAIIEAAVRSAFNFVAQEKNSNKEAFYFLSQLLDSSEQNLSLDQIRKQLRRYINSQDIDDIIAEDSEYNFGSQLTQEFVSKIGSNKFPEVLVNGVPLADEGGNSVTQSVELLEEALVGALSRHTGRLQRAVFRGELSDPDDAVEYLMKQSHIMPRLNRRVLASESSQYLDLSGTAASSEFFSEDKIHRLLHLTGRDALATALPLLRYFSKPGKPDKVTQTIWVIGDLNQKQSRDLLKNALIFMRESGAVRVAFIPNVDGSRTVDQSFNKVILAALAALEPAKATSYVVKLLDDEGCHERQDCDILPEIVPALNKYEWVLKAARVLCARSMHLRAGSRAVVHNGRIIGPFEDNEDFGLDDFTLLERYSNQVYADKIADVLDVKKKLRNEVTDDDDIEADAVLTPDTRLKLTAVLASRNPRVRTPLPVGLRTEHSMIDLRPIYDNEAAIEIVVVLDPASTAAQRLAPLLLVLRRVINCHVKLFLNPQDKNSDMPLKSFYRYVLEPELQFTQSGASTGGALARFSRLPHAPLLSMELRTPANWLVECVKSVYDLDNIRLADVETLVHSEFELEYLLLEGHAWDTTLGTPPRGLQLILGTRDRPDLMDTIVMANLGYFQLKANPGAWTLRLRPGRSEDIYEIVGHDNTDTPVGSTDIQVLMSSFRSHVIKLRVSKKPDKQHLDLLVENDDKNSGGIWNSIASSFGGGEESEAGDDTINVFSVASGHLYERFLRIMMLSVLKHTKSPVKFWFLKNYLSPSLKDILPYMAQEYGFEYELVQYQWPRWLHRQRDRQRTIWGYKILFLDVLFPLQVKKIIFVDADQIVRADLKELVDLDLGGAPYGYTPFCDSRKEMEGFRFWKQGYWRNHLQGRSYHISALYVVDLKRFRRIAAGDRLRGQYQALSQDPNSLSNLDQDLPNNMIHQVAIKSLPQEWLWCETWCDDDSKTYAKTIDLCNNPMTKEAKLSAAMRIVPEWREYDTEVKALMARVRRGLYQHQDHDQEFEIVHHEDTTSSEKDSNSVTVVLLGHESAELAIDAATPMIAAVAALEPLRAHRAPAAPAAQPRAPARVRAQRRVTPPKFK